MELSNVDNLRLNVLLAQDLKAIRINEGSMTIHALTDKGEAKVVLNPTMRDEQYLRAIRELISLKVTGSPGGFPVYIKTWTRMGHADNTLDHMLLLGEPEAVIAVVYAPTLSHDVGVRAWWANPCNEVAMRLMEYPEVIEGPLGKELAEYLMEFLPFEERQLNIVSMVRVCLQKNLISEQQKNSLWSRAQRRNPFLVGFLHAETHQIPLTSEVSKHYERFSKILEPLTDSDNIYATTLLHLLHADGQKWLKTLKLCLKKPVDQEVVISLFTAISQHFTLPLNTLIKDCRGTRSIEIALEHSNNICNTPDNEELQSLIKLTTEENISFIDAMIVLAQMGEHTLIPIFSGNESVGTVMRKRLLPLTTPLLEKVDILIS